MLLGRAVKIGIGVHWGFGRGIFCRLHLDKPLSHQGSMGLAKMFIHVFLEDLMEKPKQTFWLTQYIHPGYSKLLNSVCVYIYIYIYIYMENQYQLYLNLYYHSYFSLSIFLKNTMIGPKNRKILIVNILPNIPNSYSYHQPIVGEYFPQGMGEQE